MDNDEVLKSAYNQGVADGERRSKRIVSILNDINRLRVQLGEDGLPSDDARTRILVRQSLSGPAGIGQNTTQIPPLMSLQPVPSPSLAQKIFMQKWPPRYRCPQMPHVVPKMSQVCEDCGTSTHLCPCWPRIPPDVPKMHPKMSQDSLR